MRERLNGQEHLNSEYFNAAISDYQCLGPGHKVGARCKKTAPEPNEILTADLQDGRCAML